VKKMTPEQNKLIRMHINDRTKTKFQDDELELIFGIEGKSVNGTIAHCLEIYAGEENGLVESFTRGSISVTKKSLIDLISHYRTLQKSEIIVDENGETVAGDFFIGRKDGFGGDFGV
jgi:hypothetical protein